MYTYDNISKYRQNLSFWTTVHYWWNIKNEKERIVFNTQIWLVKYFVE